MTIKVPIKTSPSLADGDEVTDLATVSSPQQIKEPNDPGSFDVKREADLTIQKEALEPSVNAGRRDPLQARQSKTKAPRTRPGSWSPTNCPKTPIFKARGSRLRRSGWEVTCGPAELEVGEPPHVFEITVEVEIRSPKPIENTAKVEGNEPDPARANQRNDGHHPDRRPRQPQDRKDRAGKTGAARQRLHLRNQGRKRRPLRRGQRDGRRPSAGAREIPLGDDRRPAPATKRPARSSPATSNGCCRTRKRRSRHGRSGRSRRIHQRCDLRFGYVAGTVPGSRSAKTEISRPPT